MKCIKCGSTDIKSRKNYSHGNKSKSRTTMHCRNCGSVEMEVQKMQKRKWKK